MIDPNTIETIAALAGIAAIGGAVIFIATRPSRPGDHGEYLHTFGGAPEITDGRAPMVLGEEIAITLPRYWVPTHEENGPGAFTVRDREHPMAYRRKGATLYTTRSTALRASRRMNAKAAALEAEAAGCALPDYDPKWARNLHPRFQIMGWPEPFSVETLVLDTHEGAVIERWENSRQALDHATRLNGGLAATR